MTRKHQRGPATFRIRAAAQLSGVSEELIRAWERRYGILKPTRTPGGYRVYTAQDVSVLKRLKELTRQGVSIAQAAALVPQIEEELSHGVSTLPLDKNVATMVPQWIDALLDAAMAMDQATMTVMLDEAFRVMEPLDVIQDVVVPLMERVGDLWARGELGVEQEHMVSQVIRAKLMGVYNALPDGELSHVVVAGLGEDQHELGLWSAAVCLKSHGARVSLLGSNTPTAVLARAVTALAPDMVAISATEDHGEAALFRSLTDALSVLPRGIPVALGGRAAQLHGSMLEKLGITPVIEPADCPRLLKSPAHSSAA